MSSPSSMPVEQPAPSAVGRHRVVIYNNDTTLYDQVINTLIAATGCDREEAKIEAWEAHTFGKADVHFAHKDECRQVAEVIQTIGVVTEILPEWA